MKKLRLIRERAPSEWSHEGLRGMNDPEVFSRAGFFSRLAISGIPADDQRLRHTMSRYGLARNDRENGVKLSLRVHSEQPGEHKIHAITLFFAALEIHLGHPSASLLLHQHDGLKRLISARLHAHKAGSRHESETKILHAWRNANDPVSLDEATSLHLAQAGILPRTLGEFQTISRGELARIHDLLTGSHASEHTAPLRRTA